MKNNIRNYYCQKSFLERKRKSRENFKQYEMNKNEFFICNLNNVFPVSFMQRISDLNLTWSFHIEIIFMITYYEIPLPELRLVPAYGSRQSGHQFTNLKYQFNFFT